MTFLLHFWLKFVVEAKYYRHSMVDNPWTELEEKYQERNKQD